jgi:hypothetical protein
MMYQKMIHVCIARMIYVCVATMNSVSVSPAAGCRCLYHLICIFPRRAQSQTSMSLAYFRVVLVRT